MRQYQVPQFITVEDKIIGPLTLKQSGFLGTAAVLIFLMRFFFREFVFWPLAFLIGGFAVALSFLSINGQPFWVVFKNWVLYTIRPRVYIWKQTPQEKRRVQPEETKHEPKITKVPKISESKLSDLSWSLDIKHEQEREG